MESRLRILERKRNMYEKTVTADKERIKENWLKTENIIDVGLKINNMSAIIRKEKEQREKQEKHIRTLSTFIAWTIGYAVMAVIHYYVLGDFIRDVLNISPIFVSRLYTIGALIMLFCTFIVSLKNPS